MQLQLLLSRLINFRFMGAGGDTLGDKVTAGNNMPDWVKNILKPIINVLQQLLVPVIIVLGVAGAVYAIVLGVQYAKAETTDKRDEAKKRLINAVIGIVIMLVALIGMLIFVQNADAIFGWVNTAATPATE